MATGSYISVSYMLALSSLVYSQDFVTPNSTMDTTGPPSQPTRILTPPDSENLPATTIEPFIIEDRASTHATGPPTSTSSMEPPTTPHDQLDMDTTTMVPSQAAATGLEPSRPLRESSSETACVFTIQCNPEKSDCDSPPLHAVARKVSLSARSTNCNTSKVTIHILVNTLRLNENAAFSNITSLSIHGNPSSLACKRNDIGITMNAIENFELTGITISGCGLQQTITQTIFIRSALHILRCGEVTIDNVSIMNNTGSGLNIQHNQGNVTVTDSQFAYNTLVMPSSDPNTRILGGNGVYVYSSQLNQDQKQFYNFTRCTFKGNEARSDRYSFLLSGSIGSQSQTEGRGRGAGLRIISRNDRQMSAFITDCMFHKNQAFLGAGLSVQIEKNGKGNMVLVENATFTQNGCGTNNSRLQLGLGGGALLSFENLRTENQNYTIIISNSMFDSNCAELGGGAYFFSDRSTLQNNDNKIIFQNSTWINNYAHTGSAIDVTTNIFIRSLSGYLPTPTFKDCKFIRNTIHRTENSQSFNREQAYGSGTVYSSLIDLEFQSFNLFQDNNGSGIAIVNGIVDFVNSSAVFEGNRGVQGGAVFLIGTSALLVGPDQTYNFTNNIASDRGGAIYAYLVDDTDFIVSRSCFIRFKHTEKNGILYPSKHWTASMTFSGNRALQKLGHSIFATSILPCQVTSTLSKDRYQLVAPKDIFQPPGVMILDQQEEPHHISTEGKQFSRSSALLKIIPGEVSDLGILILDDFEEEVSSTLTAYMQSGPIAINSEFSCITNHTIKLSGRAGERGELVLQTVGTRKLSLILDVELVQCPPGFQLTDDDVCQCDANSYVGIEFCRDFNAFLTPGFFAGYVDNSDILATALCPVGFCSYNNNSNSRRMGNSTSLERGVVKLPSNGSQLEHVICGERRRGILCGRCREGFTTHYHSPTLDCKEEAPVSCKLGWLLYILSEIIPVTFLFLFVLVMNISFTTGAVKGFILFSQLLDTLQIDASGTINFPPTITRLSQGYRLIYGFFNLDFFAIEPLSFCLWKNASALGMLSFKYLTVFYSFMLVLSVILFMRYSAARCCGKRYSISALRNSVIHGLSGFLVLCYGQCIRVSFSILYMQDLIGRSGQEGVNEANRVFLNGEIIYFSREHLPYAIPALFNLLIIGVFPPVVLLLYPFLNKVFIWLKLEKSRLASFCLYPANKLKPLLDSFQGSFKDNLRFFAGLYFFYRWVAVVIYASITHMSLFYSIVQALLVSMLVMHSIAQPYHKTWHNILDSLLFFNLALINGITTLNYYWVRVDVGRDRDQTDLRTAVMSSIQLVLIYLPLLYAVVYVCACVIIKLFCERVSEEPEKNDFVLTKIGKKIYRSSFVGSESASASYEDSLPYRLMSGDEEADPFQQSTKISEEVEVDTYS